jgi:hypothetical protein
MITLACNELSEMISILGRPLLPWREDLPVSQLFPKGLNVHGVTKSVLGSIIWPHFIFWFFDTFCEHVSRNKLHISTNFIIFGPMDQKLWMFETFRRSLGRLGMWLTGKSWPHVQKKEGRRKNFFLQRVGLGHPATAAALQPSNYSPFS